MFKLAMLIATLLAAGAAAAQSDADRLTMLVNAYRAAPGTCQGQAAAALPPLTPQPALAAVRLTPGTILSAALERVGYNNNKADAISIDGASTPQDAMAAIQQSYCGTLLNSGYTDIGSTRNGAEWTVVLAQAAAALPSTTWPDWHDAGQEILLEVNAARSSGHDCGGKFMPPAPPLSWNAQLGDTALGHSSDMASQRYFAHVAKDGSDVGVRSRRNNYNWSRIGENIAFGMNTPQEAVAGWLSSPGHCLNIMNPGLTEMGAAYAVTPQKQAGLTYWTQVLGKPRQQ
ncbi:CAP domain-containing protein [Duganella margarita]|nr:CAP domain-containing protein [Duganella margarita]